MPGLLAAKTKFLVAGGAGSLCLLAVVGVVALVFVVFVALRLRRAFAGKPPPVSPRHHGMAIVGIITGTDDYGSWPPEAPTEMLASSWDITDTDSAVETIEQLLRDGAGGDALAFDRVRAAHLARACAGAQFLDQDSSWAYVARAGRDLQAYYDDWDDMGSAYLRAKNAWLEARSLDTHDGTEARVDQLRAGPWKVVPFDLPLPG